MATAKRFSLYPLSVTHGSAQTLNLAQLESMNINFNVAKSVITPAGAVDRAHVAVGSAAPTIGFGTRDLTTYFGVVSGTVGLCLTGTGTFRLQERSECGTFETGATHETFTVTGGFLYPQTLTATQEDEQGALLTSELVPFWDGTNNPIVHNTGVDFTAAPAPAFASRFFLGPVYHNGSLIDGVTQVTVDFGIQFSARMFNGNPYAKTGAITLRQPRITFSTAKVDDVQALSPYGNAVTSSFAVYFWKGVANGTRVAVGTSSHCKISCTAGDIEQPSVQVSGNDDGTVNVTVLPTSALSISVASTIP